MGEAEGAEVTAGALVLLRLVAPVTGVEVEVGV